MRFYSKFCFVFILAILAQSVFASEFIQNKFLLEKSSFGLSDAATLVVTEDSDGNLVADIAIYSYWKYAPMSKVSSLIDKKIDLEITTNGNQKIYSGKNIEIVKDNNYIKIDAYDDFKNHYQAVQKCYKTYRSCYLIIE